MNRVCIVAILKDEERFLDEWIIYHKMLGVDHFFLYDDDPAFPLEEFTSPYRPYVTAINWSPLDNLYKGRSRQTRAYSHATVQSAQDYDWVLFLDADEFVALRRHETVQDFLNEFPPRVNAVSLNWHLFGHNGYWDDPEGLITSRLTRRMYIPDKEVKTFSRPSHILLPIHSAHYCELEVHTRADANGNQFKVSLYPGKTDIAHINHYMCRSFHTWMMRVDRGGCIMLSDTTERPPEHHWEYSTEACLREFVENIDKDKNEYVDEYMLRYKDYLELKITERNALCPRK